MMTANEYQKLAARTLLKQPPFRFRPCPLEYGNGIDSEYTAKTKEERVIECQDINDELMMIWCAIGLSGEAGECADTVKKWVFDVPGRILKEKLLEELGDVVWYAAALATRGGLPFEAVIHNSHTLRYPDEWAHIISESEMAVVWYAIGLTGEAGKCADYVKKGVFHEHGLEKEKIADGLRDVMRYITALATCEGLTLENIMEENINKLKRRYPDGFSSERSIEREK